MASKSCYHLLSLPAALLLLGAPPSLLMRPVMRLSRRHRISWEEIKIVQNLIERCLQQYMTQTEIITALQMQANIEPGFTCLVWQKLEEQNPDFFYVYNIRLRIKDQIVAFNYLVDQQLQLLQKLQVTAPITAPGNAQGIALGNAGGAGGAAGGAAGAGPVVDAAADLNFFLSPK